MIREIQTGYFTSLNSPEILIIIGILGVFFFQNLRETSLRQMILGESEDSPLVLSFKQFVFGLFGGGLVSLMARYLHLEFHLYGEVQMVFLLTFFLLTKFSPYVNVGMNILVVYFVELIIGNGQVFLQNIVPLYFLVGLLRLVQGLILVLDYNFGFTPLLFSKGKDIRGGFKMNKSYLFPTSVGFFTASGTLLGQSLFYFLLYPVFNVKETFTGFTKSEATFVMAGLKMISGSFLLILALAGSFITEFIYVVLLLGPLIIQGEVFVFRKIERMQNPRFVSTTRNVVVLDVKRTSPAYLAGLRSGHRVTSLNRKPNPSYQELIDQVIVATYPREIDLTVKDDQQRAKTIRVHMEENMNLGILFVPPSEAIDFQTNR